MANELIVILISFQLRALDGNCAAMGTQPEHVPVSLLTSLNIVMGGMLALAFFFNLPIKKIYRSLTCSSINRRNVFIIFFFLKHLS
jgi:hypothetical protein